MVLSINSGSRLASDSGGIGRGALDGATEAMPAIYLVVPQAPGPGRPLTAKTGDADVYFCILSYCEKDSIKVQKSHYTVSVLDNNTIIKTLLQMWLQKVQHIGIHRRVINRKAE